MNRKLLTIGMFVLSLGIFAPLAMACGCGSKVAAGSCQQCGSGCTESACSDSKMTLAMGAADQGKKTAESKPADVPAEAPASDVAVEVPAEAPAAETPVEVGNKICPVSGEKVGEMGEIVKYEYKGKVYNLCCAMCVKDFQNDPEKYSKIADEEMSANTK